MSTSTISSVLANSSASYDGTSAANSASPSNQLDENDFLNLLVTKMKEQDPMNPQSDTDFIAQMAQFSTLEQSKSMASQQELSTANALIGRNVSVADSQNGPMQGMVSGVTTNSGSSQIIINGAPYSLDSVTSVSPFAPTV